VSEPSRRQRAEISPQLAHPADPAPRTTDVTTSAPPSRVDGSAAPGAPWRPGIAAGALVGVIGVGLAIGIAELVAALGMWIDVLHTTSSPLTSLGQSFIALTPEWLKEFAIRTFGQHDKAALTAGMGVTLFLVAVVIGIVGRRRPRAAVAITVVLIAVAAVAILTRAGSTVIDLLPLLVGGAAGVVFLVMVLRRQVATPALSGGPEGQDEGSIAPRSGSTDAETLATVQSKEDTGFGAGVDRRQFFRVAVIGGVAAAVAGALARWIPSTAEVTASRSAVSLPVPKDAQKVGDVGLKVDGITPFVTDNADFYRVDTAFVVPRITTDGWQLRLHGMVDKEVTLDYNDLVAMPSIERMITLTCVSNEVGGDLAGNARWQGVRIADVLAMAGPQEGADCVLSSSSDGFTVTTPLEALTDGRDALLAFAMNGVPLPVEHGFPVRMVVPGLYGYVSGTKWVVDLNVTQFSEVSAYWTERGWSPRGPIKTASRIDVPNGSQVSKGTVAVAGVAWAQHRGISGVQVQIDGGSWQDATLSGEVSADTWRQWLYQWDAANAGEHTIRCRAIDGSGAVQTDQVQGVIPDGATGLDTRQVTVTA